MLIERRKKKTDLTIVFDVKMNFNPFLRLIVMFEFFGAIFDKRYANLPFNFFFLVFATFSNIFFKFK